MITLLVLILIVVFVGFCCVIAAIASVVDTLTENLVAMKASSTQPSREHLLRPHARDGTTIEDLVSARKTFESGKPDPLPALGPGDGGGQ